MRLYELLFEGIEEKVSHLAKSMSAKLARAAQHDSSAKEIVSAIDHDNAEKTIALEVLKKLATADPTGNRADALVWIARMYSAWEFLLEDIPRVRNDLTKFFQYRSKIQNKDLNSYKSLSQLYDAVEAVEGQDDRSARQAQKQAKVEGAEKVLETPNVTVVKLLTPEAANLYGKGTKWCTTSENGNAFQTYAKQGPLYAILVSEGGKQRKFQFHYESDQFMDERDRPVSEQDIAMLSKYDGYTKFLNMMIEKHYSKYFEDLEKTKGSK